MARECVRTQSSDSGPARWLPAGGRLSPRRFQQLGIAFGASDGFEGVHYLLEEAFVQGPAGRELSYAFLRAFENRFSFETDPIYFLLHEPEYSQGEASRWSAERVRAHFAEFDLGPDKPVLFTGEMVYPWMAEDYEALRPLRACAEILAEKVDWPRLYDLDVLRANTVPVAAAVYLDDMYVESTYSQETAAFIPGVRAWITNEYEHNALRADGQTITLPTGYRRVHLLAAATAGPIQVNLKLGEETVSFSVAPFAGYLGQWDNRIFAGAVPSVTFSVQNPLRRLAPAYLRKDRVAWAASHLHRAGGDLPYQYGYLYSYSFDIPPNATVMSLPRNPELLIFAGAVSTEDNAEIRVLSSLWPELARDARFAQRFDSLGR